MQIRSIELGAFSAITAQHEQAEHACVFLHGFGANSQDLLGLAHVLKFAEATDFYFLNAPLTIFPGGFSWFPLDPMRLESVLQSGDEATLLSLFQPGIAEIGQKVAAALNNLPREYSQLFLGGFSQGSMVAIEAAFHLRSNIAGGLLFSSAPANLNDWRTHIAQESARFPVFQSHGRQDPVLPFRFGQRLAELWQAQQWTHDFVDFSGGHEIPPQVLEAVVKFKDRHAAADRSSL